MEVTAHATSDTPAIYTLSAALAVLVLSDCGDTSEAATTSPTSTTTRPASEPERRDPRQARFAQSFRAR
jgi:hypothetical protein